MVLPRLAIILFLVVSRMDLISVRGLAPGSLLDPYDYGFVSLGQLLVSLTSTVSKMCEQRNNTFFRKEN